MNVWYLSAHDQPRGQSSRTYDFARELMKRGHSVTMFTNSYNHWTHEDLLNPQERWRITEIDGIRVIWLRTIPYRGNGWRRGANMISNAWRALQVARQLADKPDVVIGPSVPLGTGWAARRIAASANAAFVFEVRDVWPIALVDDGSISKMSPIYVAFRALEKYLYRKAHRVSAAVPFIFDHVAESGGDPEHVTWIPNGVDFERFDQLEAYDGGCGKPVVVMYVGGFGAAHDVISLVRAASILERDGLGEDFHFVIIGDGPKRSACEREAVAAGLSNIEFRDPVPKSEVSRVQTESDILVACITESDVYRFGLNLNKIWDYFGSGRPVVFSGNAPNDPIASSGAGFSVPPEDPDALADALRALREMTPEQRADMGARGRVYVEKEYDMRSLGARMESLLLEAVAESSTP